MLDKQCISLQHNNHKSESYSWVHGGKYNLYLAQVAVEYQGALRSFKASNDPPQPWKEFHHSLRRNPSRAFNPLGPWEALLPKYRCRRGISSGHRLLHREVCSEPDAMAKKVWEQPLHSGLAVTRSIKHVKK